MRNGALLMTIACTALTPAFGQLYLISGSPTPKYVGGYSTVLVAVAADGSVKIAQEIVPARFGTEWMTTSSDARKALILPKSPDDHIIVFDFNTASVTKSCPQPPTTGLLLVGQWLVDAPSHGLMFTQYLASSDRQSKTDQFSGMVMDSAVPCQNSFVNLDASDIKYVVADGFAGVTDTGASDLIDASFGTDGALSGGWLSGERTYYDYKVPPPLFNDMSHPVAAILINNRQILGLRLAASTERRFLVFRKSDSTWHKVPNPSLGRAFGSFVASAEAGEKGKSTSESVGNAEWRQKDAATGPAGPIRFRIYPLVYPGILHLYDAATERAYAITTNQGDSEILLVENGTVYYRVTNRLYSAAIEGAVLGAAKLLATDDLIEDAHWAFIKR